MRLGVVTSGRILTTEIRFKEPAHTFGSKLILCEIQLFFMTLSERSASSHSFESVHPAHAHPHPKGEGHESSLLQDNEVSDGSTHPHVHSEESLRRIINRLSRIEGHIRGIKSMVQESRPCPEVLVQVAAVRGALNRVSRIILDEHLTECVGRAAREGNIEEELEELKSALDRFLP